MKKTIRLPCACAAFVIMVHLVAMTLFTGGASSVDAGVVSQSDEQVIVDPLLQLRPRAGRFADGPLVMRALERACKDDVRVQLEHFLTDKREAIRRSLSLSTRYLDHIVPILENHGLPGELSYLCLIESGYRQSARSHAGAVGMWQMIKATSVRFGLKTDHWVDERLDFELSTEAAARFFVYLLERFDDWDHVLAAYNAGEGRVRKAVERAKKLGVEPEIGNLKLPRETRIYIPAFYAAVLIAIEPERYGIYPDYEPSIDFMEVKVPGGVKLSEAAGEFIISEGDLAVLNTCILRDRIPPVPGGYMLRIPSSADIDHVMAAAERMDVVEWIAYRVRKGDTIWDISRKFGVNAKRIDRSGRAKNPSRIYPGEVLMIPIKAGSAGAG